MGNSTEDFFRNILSGLSGIRKVSTIFPGSLSVSIAAEVDFNPSGHFSLKQARNLDRTSQMALVASSQAWKDSGLSLNDEERVRAGVYIGTGMGGSHTIEDVSFQLFKKDVSRVNPLSITKIMSNAPASHISVQFGLRGPCLTFSVACASSAVAIGEACRMIKYGLCDLMIAGGTESMLTYSSFKCWESLGVLAVEDQDNPSASCKPFSKDRTGFVLGEGAAILVLEEMEMAKTRGAEIYGEIRGYGSASDAHHITFPTVDGQTLAMEMALKDAGVSADSIDYINAHGTATAANDIIETQAIKKVFGGYACRIPVSSTKSMHGHLVGAAGALEFAAALLAIKNKSIPPTANLMIPDPACDLDYVPNEGRVGQKVRTVMSNSFAFGGSNAVLIASEV